MSDPRHDLLTDFQTVRAELLASIEGLTPDQMTETTFDGWSVKDHLMHLAGWDRIRAEEIDRISAGWDSAWALNDAQDETFNDLLYAKHKDLSLDQVIWELTDSRKRLMTALENVTDRGLDASFYRASGPAPRHEAEHAGWIRAWRQSRGY